MVRGLKTKTVQLTRRRVPTDPVVSRELQFSIPRIDTLQAVVVLAARDMKGAGAAVEVAPAALAMTVTAARALGGSILPPVLPSY